MYPKICPCGQGDYASCCAPLHQGQTTAATAEQLMRSRYSAFALQQIDYIVQTTAPGQQADLDIPALRDWSTANRWLGLQIINVQPRLGKHHAKVEFIARYHDGQQLQQHQELSSFVQSAGQWFFLDPTIPVPVSMKQPCLCGSGKKFKHCCAPFLLSFP